MNATAWLLLGIFGAAQPDAADTDESREVYSLLDGLYVSAEPAARLGQGNACRLTVLQSYPTPLRRFRITGSHPGLTIRVEPEEVPAFKIGDTMEFVVHAAPLPNARLDGDRVTVPLSFAADELDSKQTWPLVIPLTAAAEQELRDADALPMGTVEVRVRWWAGWETWAYAGGCTAIPAALAWRWWRGRHRRAARPRLSEPAPPYSSRSA